MKEIIVPVDFSRASKQAFQYALGLSEVLGSPIRVVHVFSSSFTTNEPFLLKAGMGRQAALEAELNSFINEEEGNVAIKVTSEVIFGGPVRELIKKSKSEETRMIIMGQKGAGQSSDRFLGSVSTAVSRDAACPVVLVHEDNDFKPYSNILFASNYESIDNGTLGRLMEFAQQFKAGIHFVHINDEHSEETFNLLKTRIFETLFKEEDLQGAFHLTRFSANSVHEGLNDYAEDHDIDLVIMVTPHKSFWERILHQSQTKAMALTSKVPILVYHTDN